MEWVSVAEWRWLRVIWVAKGLIVLGAAFFVIAAIGVNRLPDFYSRAHAATKPDTLGLVCLLLGLAIYDGIGLNTLKMLLIVLFVFLANPVASHALGRAAIRNGLLPWTVREGKQR